MNLQVHLGVHVAAMLFECLFECQQVGFGVFSRQQSHGTRHHLIGSFAQCQTLRGVHFGVAHFGRFGRLGRLGFGSDFCSAFYRRCRRFGHLLCLNCIGVTGVTHLARVARLTTPSQSNFFSPHRHRRCGFVGIVTSRFGLKQRCLKGFPNTAQLVLRGFKLGWKFQIDTVP